VTAIDLNADVGEGGDDAPLYAVVSSVNVACGGHAGDAASMLQAVRLAQAHGVALGAHPSYPDRAGFGRRAPQGLARPQLLETWRAQVQDLAAVALRNRVPLRHCKPHGALYHDLAQDPELAEAIAAAWHAECPGLPLVVLAGSPAERHLRARGIPVAAEGFADRGYTPEGGLLPRSAPGGVLHEPRAAAAQAVALVRRGGLDTLCVHGDTPGALALARAVREALLAEGLAIRPLPWP
jgi:UPF0271 protein